MIQPDKLVGVMAEIKALQLTVDALEAIVAERTECGDKFESFVRVAQKQQLRKARTRGSHEPRS
jgi:hypothetical protein